MDVRRGRPVTSFPMEFEWMTGEWEQLFDAQVDYIKDELRRAQAADRVVVYLSCPISSRGGGHHQTNVDIADHTARRLLMAWGTNYFILNPSQYQMESREGTGLIQRHAERLKIDLVALEAKGSPGGGDYMRMWTRVLVEDEYLRDSRLRGKQLGGLFAAYYFLGPSDVRDFFTKGGAQTVTAGIEEYFARKYAMDPLFRSDFTPDQCRPREEQARDWAARRLAFFRYYAVRAGVNYSKGSHDEWNIWVLLNQGRLQDSAYGLGSQIAGFFDGAQVDPGASETRIARGYELSTGRAVAGPNDKPAQLSE